MDPADPDLKKFAYPFTMEELMWLFFTNVDLAFIPPHGTPLWETRPMLKGMPESLRPIMVQLGTFTEWPGRHIKDTL